MNVTAIGKSFSCSAKNICRRARNIAAAGVIAMTPAAKADGGAIYNSASKETSSALTNVLENLARINAGNVGNEVSGSFRTNATTAVEFGETLKGLTNGTSSALADVRYNLDNMEAILKLKSLMSGVNKPNGTISSPTTAEEFAEALKGMTNSIVQEGGAIYNSASGETSNALTNVLENLARINAGNVGNEVSGSFRTNATTAVEFGETLKGLTNGTSSALADVQRKLAELTVLKPNATAALPTSAEEEFAQTMRTLTNKTAQASSTSVESNLNPQSVFTNTYAEVRLYGSDNVDGAFTNLVKTASCPITPGANVANSTLSAVQILGQDGKPKLRIDSINSTDSGTIFNLSLGDIEEGSGKFFKSILDTTNKFESSLATILDK